MLDDGTGDSIGREYNIVMKNETLGFWVLENNLFSSNMRTCTY